ncbi:hypothetical protein FRC06_004968 [Ceratobasidium sp. 370]|nr:hypothetical protein FRC06_004968 [Ceratobasidium sp. 370]
MPRKTFECDRCRQKFRYKNSLEQHIQDKHIRRHRQAAQSSSSNPENQCRYCGNELTGGSGLVQHLRKKEVCREVHKKWLDEVATTLSSEELEEPAAPEYDADSDLDVEESSSDSEAGPDSTQDSDNDSDDERSESGESRHDHDLPWPEANIFEPIQPPGVEPMDLDEEVELEERVDLYGRKVYIEHYPNPDAGQPIRLASAEERAGGAYPDVGELKKLDVFEVVQCLIESGMSGKFRNRYLRLRRLRGTMPWNNNRELVKDVDKLLHGPNWSVQAMEIEGS